MKCGDKGHVTAAGQPCGQVIAADAPGCIWHTGTPEQRHAFALKGGFASRLLKIHALPVGTPDPRFATREEIVRWAERVAGQVMRGELDPKLAAEARQLAGLALAVRQQESLEALARALSVLENGAGAVLLLERLRDGLADGRRRPLPGRAPALPAADGEGA